MFIAIRIKWDEYEVALLVHYYCKIQEGAISFEAATIELSDRLRKKAIRKGLQIDNIYRNTNGMSMKLGNMQYLFTEGKKGFNCHSKMDKDIYELYKNDNKKYKELLKKALEMTD